VAAAPQFRKIYLNLEQWRKRHVSRLESWYCRNWLGIRTC
jgi:hypothetical protein